MQKTVPQERSVVGAAAQSERVLAYHELSYAPSSDVYQLTPDRFAEHLLALQAGRRISSSHLTITFDDAHVSQIELGVPVLDRFRVKGCFFVPTAFVGTRRETGSWADLRQLVREGHTVGSHGETHSFLTSLSPTALALELARSKHALEDSLGLAVNTISAPGGRWNATVTAAVEAAGYLKLYTSDPNPAPGANREISGLGIEILGRLCVRRTMSATTIAAYVARRWHVTTRFSAEYRAKALAKQLLGDRRYQSLWAAHLRHPVEGGPLG